MKEIIYTCDNCDKELKNEDGCYNISKHYYGCVENMYNGFEDKMNENIYECLCKDCADKIKIIIEDKKWQS